MTLNSSISTQKQFKVAPLPFTGQKRLFLRHFEKILKENITNDGEGLTVLDVFGGSGLLAHNAKRILPKATVIYNDFDGYARRLAHIDDTNRLRRVLADILKDTPRSQKLDKDTKNKVLNAIFSFDGFVDVQALPAWILFSGQQLSCLDELAKQTLYNRIKKSDYELAGGYLNGLVIECLDFERLIQKYQNTPNCLLLLDPPYLCTAQGAYAMHGYFGMTKFLTLMHYVRPPYVFFSSTRSELLDYMDYLKTYDPQKWQIVGGFDRIAVNSSVNKQVRYEDNILSKF